MPERIAYALEPHKLPVVLSAEEVVRFVEARRVRLSAKSKRG